MAYFFVINPGSRQNRAAEFIPTLFTELKHHKIDFTYKLTATMEDAQSLSLAANEKGYDTVVAVGGDGTINKVLNGFYDAQGKRNSLAKFGVIHTGTSPDFCKSYGIPTQPSLAMETLLRGCSKKISVARIEYHDNKGKPKTGYYACCASFGVGAKVAQRANSGVRKYLGDSLGTLGSILVSLSKYRASDLELICDGEKLTIKNNFNTFIGKTRFIASGLKVEHNLASDDERLYLLSVKNLTWRNVIPAIQAVYSGKAGYDKDYLAIRYARSIEVPASKSNNEVEFDGDPQGFLPCKISLATDKLELITDEP